MQRNHFLRSLLVAISLAGFVSAVATAAANEPKGTKHDQQQTHDTTSMSRSKRARRRGKETPTLKN